MQKIAVVTGGGRGLGKNMALRLAEKGTDVIITYVSKKEEAENVVKEIEAMGRKGAVLKFDAADFKGIDGFVNDILAVLKSKWNTDKFDYLINNAGIGQTVKIEDMTEEIFDKFLNVHFKTVYFLTQKSLPNMNDNGGIINISSGTTRFCVSGYSVYASFKSAIETFTKYLTKEIGHRGMTANVVAPGAIETDFNNAGIRNNPIFKEHLASMTPLGRVGKADDIGGVVAFLCSEDAKWINGQRIEVSGGIN
ncbi:MAG: SDR family NAD(P)-dependent oxidoreductase [Ignavibacteria bacterium]